MKRLPMLSISNSGCPVHTHAENVWGTVGVCAWKSLSVPNHFGTVHVHSTKTYGLVDSVANWNRSHLEHYRKEICVIETFLHRPLPPCTTHTRSLFLCTWFLSPQITSKLCLFIELSGFFFILTFSISKKGEKHTSPHDDCNS